MRDLPAIWDKFQNTCTDSAYLFPFADLRANALPAAAFEALLALPSTLHQFLRTRRFNISVGSRTAATHG
jgi:hypothetical protein